MRCRTAPQHGTTKAERSRQQKRRQRLRGRRRFVPEARRVPIGPAADRCLGSPIARSIARRVHRRREYRAEKSPTDARGVNVPFRFIRRGPVRKRSVSDSVPVRFNPAIPPALPPTMIARGSLHHPGRTWPLNSTKHSRIASRPFPRSREASCFSNDTIAGCARLSRGLSGHFYALVARSPAPAWTKCASAPGGETPWHAGCALRGESPGTSGLAATEEVFHHVHRWRPTGAHPDHRRSHRHLLVGETTRSQAQLPRGVR